MVNSFIIQSMGVAFGLSQKLHRPQGRVFLDPFAHLLVSNDQLIEFVASVSGLNGVRLLQHRIVTEDLVSTDFRGIPSGYVPLHTRSRREHIRHSVGRSRQHRENTARLRHLIAMPSSACCSDMAPIAIGNSAAKFLASRESDRMALRCGIPRRLQGG